MHSILGFLGLVTLLLTRVNYAHADTAGEDAEGLLASMIIASKVESSSLGLTHWDSTQGDGEIETAAGRTDHIGGLDSSREKHIQAQDDSSRTESGLQAMPDSLSVRTGRENDRGTSKWTLRIGKKLGAGALGGALSGFLLEQILIGLNRNDGNDFGASFFFGQLIGYTFVTPISVSRVDQHDHYLSALAGSVMGLMLIPRAIGVSSSVDERSDMWPLLASSVIGATIMSELSRYAPAASRFSLGVSPDRRGGMSAVAVLRF